MLMKKCSDEDLSRDDKTVIKHKISHLSLPITEISSAIAECRTEGEVSLSIRAPRNFSWIISSLQLSVKVFQHVNCRQISDLLRLLLEMSKQIRALYFIS